MPAITFLGVATAAATKAATGVNTIQILKTVLFGVVMLLIVLIGIYFVLLKNSGEPEVKRKWADPKFHD